MPPNPNSHCQAMHDTEFTGTASAMFEHVMKIMPTVMIVVMFTDSAFTVLYSAADRSQMMHAMPTTAKIAEMTHTAAVSIAVAVLASARLILHIAHSVPAAPIEHHIAGAVRVGTDQARARSFAVRRGEELRIVAHALPSVIIARAAVEIAVQLNAAAAQTIESLNLDVPRAPIPGRIRRFVLHPIAGCAQPLLQSGRVRVRHLARQIL